MSLVQTFKEQSSVLTAALNYYCSLRALGGLAFGQAAPIEAETLVVWGEQDSALSTKLLDGFTGVAPRVRVHRWPDVSHWVQNEAPEEPNQLLLEFLGSQD